MNSSKISAVHIMEPFSLGLLICGVTVAMYQMSGTPFVLNIVIFCSVLSLCLYAMFISGYYMPSDALYYWINPTAKKTSVHEDGEEDEEEGNNLHDDQITKKLREFTGHIVRDFILSWYNAVTDDVTFVQEVFELFEHLLICVRARVTHANRERLLANIFTVFVEHIITYKKASMEVDAKGYKKLEKDEAERRNQLLAVAYCSENGHPAMTDLPDSEMEYLRGIVVLLLKGLLPENYKLTGTPLYLVRELIATNVLNSLVNMMSDPLWICNTLAKISEKNENVKPEESELRTNCDNMHESADTETVNIRGDCDSPPVHSVSDTVIKPDFSEPRHSISSPSFGESGLSVSQSSSLLSQVSEDSQDLDELSSETLKPEDIPLPLLSSELHFAPEWNDADHDAATAQKHLLSVAIDSTPQEKLFLRIRIPENTTMKENFDGGKYTLYRITYRTREKVQSSSAISIPNGEGTSTQEDCQPPEPQIVSKRHQVQRRFREFLVLQERLSHNMVAKNLIADIKGPSRMFPVPFGNMDKEYIEQRRKFLQAYLREICSIAFITHTKELREFLAYEMDPWIAYVKKPDPMPRFDKLFTSAIKDLLGSTAMKFSSIESEPVLQDEQPDGERNQRCETNAFAGSEVSNVGAVAKLKNKVFGPSKNHSRDSTAVTKTNRQFCDFEGQRAVFSAKWRCEDEINHRPAEANSYLENRPAVRGTGDGCDTANTPAQNIDPDILPASLIFKLILHLWDVKPGTHGLTSLAFTKYFQAHLSEKLDDLTSKQTWTKLLGKLHESMWPEGRWESRDADKKTWSSASKEEKNEATLRAERGLEQVLPRALRYLMDEEAFKNGVKDAVLSLQNTNINRQLIFSLLDLVTCEVFPDLDQVIQRGHVSLNTLFPASL